MSASIFIVEDERIVAEDIRVTLESNGYTVAGIASSRDDALAGIARTSPDLVLMDIGLRGPGDGVDAARQVRARFDLPVVYLTAHADAATLHRAKLTEPFGYIVKPFEERDLFPSIELALYRHGMEKRTEEKERWLSTILASIDDGVIAADSMGVVTLANAAAERISGWKREELTGLDLADVYRVQDVGGGLAVAAPFPPAFLEEDGRGTRKVRLLTRKDGGTALVEQSISAVGGAFGRASGSVVVFRELAHVERAEAERR